MFSLYLRVYAFHNCWNVDIIWWTLLLGPEGPRAEDCNSIVRRVRKWFFRYCARSPKIVKARRLTDIAEISPEDQRLILVNRNCSELTRFRRDSSRFQFFHWPSGNFRKVTWKAEKALLEQNDVFGSPDMERPSKHSWSDFGRPSVLTREMDLRQ